jgi:hypothetical protein
MEDKIIYNHGNMVRVFKIHICVRFCGKNLIPQRYATAPEIPSWDKSYTFIPTLLNIIRRGGPRGVVYFFSNFNFRLMAGVLKNI